MPLFTMLLGCRGESEVTWSTDVAPVVAKH